MLVRVPNVLTAEELRHVVSTLEAVEISDWETRFGQLEPPAPVLESTCLPQPVFGSTLVP